MSGTVVGKGRFRVDRKLALEKMEKFQLEDPYRYVLELVAAAVCAGAERITITNDSDDFVIAWTGMLPTRAELDGLFDALFGHPDDAREHLLQHLAVGTLGALGLSPRWLRIDRGPTDDEPGVRLDIREATETVTVDRDEDLDGMRIAVREQLGPATMAEALTLLFRDPIEARLIQGAARWCPVPIRINDRPMPSAIPTQAVAGGPTQNGHLWLVPLTDGIIDVVRHGIVVGHVPGWRLGAFSVTGWLRDDALRLNASRSAVVEDDRWRTFLSALEAAQAAFVRRLFDDPLPSAVRDEIALPALERLGPTPFGSLGALPVLVDAVGCRWSADALRALDPPPSTSVGPFDPGDPRPVFLGAHARIVGIVFPEAVDRTEEIRVRLAGVKRRAETSRKRFWPWFEEPAIQRRFERGTLKGAVRLREPITLGPVRVSLRIAGTELGTTSLAGAGPAMEAILDDPAFQADLGFEHIVRDATWDAAAALLAEQATTHIVGRLQGSVAPDRIDLLTACLRAPPDRGDLRTRAATTPAEVTELPLVPTGTGSRTSIRAILTSDTAWVVLDHLPPGTPPELAARVLLLPPELSQHWTRWLSGSDPAAFRIDVSRAARLAGPRRAATFAGPVPDLAVDVDVPGITGVLGLWRYTAPPGVSLVVTLLRAGVPVCDVGLPVGLAGVCGVLDVPDLDVDRAHAALASPAVLADLAERLAAPVEALALALWGDQAGPVPGRVCGWLKATRTRWSEAVHARPIATWSDGRPVTLAELSQRALTRKGPKIGLVQEGPPSELGLDDLLVAPLPLVALLNAWIPNKVVDAKPEVRATAQAAEKFRARPLADEPPVLVERTVEGDGLRVRYAIPRDPSRAGELRLEARWGGRVLATRTGKGPGPTVVIDGERVRPDRTWTTLRDPALFDEAEKGAAGIAIAMLHEALAGPVLPEDVPVWLKLRTLLGPPATIPATELRNALDLAVRLACLDGRTVAIAELRQRNVVRVSADLARGASPFATAVLDRPNVAAALVDVPDETAAVLAWRAGQERRKGLRKREAVLTRPMLRKMAFVDGAVRGELGIPTDPDASDALLVEPLADGLPLAPIGVPFPAPMYAALDGLVADPAFERTTLPPQTLQRLRAAAHALARAAVAEAGGDPVWRGWMQRYVLADPAGGAAEVFPVLGGSFVSRETLEARSAARGALAVVSRDGLPRLPVGPQPVVASIRLRTALARSFRLVDLDSVIASARVAPPFRSEVFVSVAAPRRGSVGFVASRDGVEVRLGSIGLGRLDSNGPVPLGGWIEDPAIPPTPGWNGFEEGPATDALREALLAMSRTAAEGLADLFRTTDDPVHQAILIDALRRLAPTPTALRALVRGALPDPLATRIAGVPLFVDGGGRRGSLLELVAERPIRAVSTRTTAYALPGRSPFWRLDAETRAWLSLAERVVDAEAAAAVEHRGHERRTGPVLPRAWSPGALPIEGEGFSGALWLGTVRESPTVRVDGREVMSIALGVRGVAGYVDGSWPTDDGFTRVELPGSVSLAIERVLAALLQAEAQAAPWSFADRLEASAHLNRVSEPYRSVQLPGATLGAISDDLARHDHLLWADTGESVGVHGRPVLPMETQAMLASAFPSVKFVRASDAPVKRQKPERQEVASERRQARTRDAIASLAASWAGPDLQAEARAEVARWTVRPPPWLAQVDGDRAVAIAAWAAVAAVAPGEVELALLERLVRALER